MNKNKVASRVTSYILEVENLTKKYLKLIALDGVSLKVKYGEVHAVVGENGAGKSTLMKVIGGVIKPDQGKVIFQRKKVFFKNPKDAINSGIAYIHQELSLIPSLSVMINVFLHQLPNNYGFVDLDKLEDKSGEILNILGYSINPHTLVKELNISQRQLVEIAKALSFNSKLIMMDEPSAALSEKETDHLFKVIKEIKGRGSSIIYVSHKIEEVVKISDRVTVLREGRYIGTLEKEDIKIPRIVQMMLGRNPVYVVGSESYKKGPILLEVQKLTGEKFNDISFTLHAGEIIGITGLVGTGKSALARAIFGVESIYSGNIFFEGVPIKLKSPQDALNKGIVMMAEDRETLSLFTGQSLKLNISIAKLPYMTTPLGIINHQRLYNMLDELVKIFNIKFSSYNEPIYKLSSGNQQKAVLARCISLNPKLLILDEPTHGIDIGSRLEIYHYLNALIQKGVGIILISSELSEIMLMANKTIVMRDGHIVDILDEKQLSDFLQVYSDFSMTLSTNTSSSDGRIN